MKKQHSEKLITELLSDDQIEAVLTLRRSGMPIYKMFKILNISRPLINRVLTDAGIATGSGTSGEVRPIVAYSHPAVRQRSDMRCTECGCMLTVKPCIACSMKGIPA